MTTTAITFTATGARTDPDALGAVQIAPDRVPAVLQALHVTVTDDEARTVPPGRDTPPSPGPLLAQRFLRRVVAAVLTNLAEPGAPGSPALDRALDQDLRRLRAWAQTVHQQQADRPLFIRWRETTVTGPGTASDTAPATAPRAAMQAASPSSPPVSTSNLSAAPTAAPRAAQAAAPSRTAADLATESDHVHAELSGEHR